MTTVSLPEAQRDLPKLIRGLSDGGTFLIMDQGKPVARVDSIKANEPISSLRDIRPTSVGALLKPLDLTEDLLDEMIGEK
jgi:antitoxin (DNA-binding transcriptional repressor) of toxin-antitoxin stability system